MIGAYGIVNRLAFIFVMIVMGINQGMQPIAGYNFGAQQYDRVLKVLRLTIVCAVCVTSSGFVVGEFMPHLAVSLFTTDEEPGAAGRGRHAHRLPLLPDHRVPDGGDELFPEYRHGRQRRSSCRCRASWSSCCRACCSCPASSRPIPIGAAAGACGAPCPVGPAGYGGGLLHADVSTAEIPGRDGRPLRQRIKQNDDHERGCS